jgi:hypothetical protein
MDQEGQIRWILCLDVTITGIELPFRLRFATDNHEDMLEALAEFQCTLLEKIQENLE